MRFPELTPIRQRLPAPAEVDVAVEVAARVDALAGCVRPGMHIAITAGSRGIAQYPVLLAALVARLKGIGAVPFLVPAMGSHGGASAEGQVEVLESLGITESSVGCTIVSSLEVIHLGETAEGVPVWVDRAAAEADGIIVVNRVKPHTDFVGEVESGLLKMMAVGLGKCAGAASVHSHGLHLGMARVVPAVGQVVLSHCRILFGLAVLEDAHHRVARVVGVEPAQMEQTERQLLREAQALTPGLPCGELDVLVVDEMGKEISGTGLDTKVIGRIRISGTCEPLAPRIRRIVVRDLTAASRGNALGVGLADVVTRKLADKIDQAAMYENAIASSCPEQAYLPVVAATDREAIQFALSMIGAVPPEQARLMRTHNTRDLEYLSVSTALLPELGGRCDIEVLGQTQPLSFDATGRLL
ncbi:MAG: hypothetical protein BWY10_02454 [Chloroflexi bacterium ADurb.Bin180]|nr:MAG: hypothetical protein BWY10_02454 [Chloroflexi bacterium ADurb.Bin180]